MPRTRSQRTKAASPVESTKRQKSNVSLHPFITQNGLYLYLQPWHPSSLFPVLQQLIKAIPADDRRSAYIHGSVVSLSEEMNYIIYVTQQALLFYPLSQTPILKAYALPTPNLVTLPDDQYEPLAKYCLFPKQDQDASLWILLADGQYLFFSSLLYGPVVTQQKGQLAIEQDEFIKGMLMWNSLEMEVLVWTQKKLILVQIKQGHCICKTIPLHQSAPLLAQVWQWMTPKKSNLSNTLNDLRIQSVAVRASEDSESQLVHVLTNQSLQVYEGYRNEFLFKKQISLKHSNPLDLILTSQDVWILYETERECTLQSIHSLQILALEKKSPFISLHAVGRDSFFIIFESEIVLLDSQRQPQSLPLDDVLGGGVTGKQEKLVFTLKGTFLLEETHVPSSPITMVDALQSSLEHYLVHGELDKESLSATDCDRLETLCEMISHQLLTGQSSLQSPLMPLTQQLEQRLLFHERLSLLFPENTNLRTDWERMKVAQHFYTALETENVHSASLDAMQQHFHHALVRLSQTLQWSPKDLKRNFYRFGLKEMGLFLVEMSNLQGLVPQWAFLLFSALRGLCSLPLQRWWMNKKLLQLAELFPSEDAWIVASCVAHTLSTENDEASKYLMALSHVNLRLSLDWSELLNEWECLIQLLSQHSLLNEAIACLSQQHGKVFHVALYRHYLKQNNGNALLQITHSDIIPFLKQEREWQLLWRIYCKWGEWQKALSVLSSLMETHTQLKEQYFFASVSKCLLMANQDSESSASLAEMNHLLQRIQLQQVLSKTTFSLCPVFQSAQGLCLVVQHDVTQLSTHLLPLQALVDIVSVHATRDYILSLFPLFSSVEQQQEHETLLKTLWRRIIIRDKWHELDQRLVSTTTVVTDREREGLLKETCLYFVLNYLTRSQQESLSLPLECISYTSQSVNELKKQLPWLKDGKDRQRFQMDQLQENKVVEMALNECGLHEYYKEMVEWLNAE